ncbi:MAG: hypothetical protein F6K65_27720, partial [Moorea sp. SIO3C2]|nr:hypothetical protein [Moorena sp. SIO3C2]
IADIHTYFDPQQTPTEFLPWLSTWVALSLRADLDVSQQQDFIANTVERYRFRGTKANLQALLELFLEEKATITITETTGAELQIGDSQLLNQIDDPEQLPPESILGKATYLGGGEPHCFVVIITLSKGLSPQELNRQVEIATAIIEQEKPAHTKYRLEIIYPTTIQIGTFDNSTGEGTGSQIGIDTLLGNIPRREESGE